MDRKSLRNFTHNAENFLTTDSNFYKQWIFRYTFLELEKDLGSKGDITTDSIFEENRKAKAQVLANSNGIIAGLEEIRYFLVDSDPSFKPNIEGNFNVNFNKKDGDNVKSGEVLMEITAGIKDLMVIERIILNLLTRMCGIATFTRKIVDKVKDYDVLLTPTRKTLWGLLDKKAVVIGGGGTHRLNLTDAVLIKDNHLVFGDYDFDKILKKVIEKDPQCRFIEIEADNIDDAIKTGEAFKKYMNSGDVKCVGAVMLDNMKSEDVSKALKLLKEKNIYDSLLFEASGGIKEANVLEYAKTGVDIISMGCLTGGVECFDLKMQIV
ncbi:carboxylating nicotinate-nucleotide diphosphorylase [Candidatus Peregrinibacteria bacterium]|nr:carboxylating nicotinate-nucleotide diphosphorylase [Candidatus Peregrinibacteria bacterium]